jgi:transposase
MAAYHVRNPIKKPSQVMWHPAKLETGLSPWIERACASLIASFASSVAKDEAAVRAAITSSWSNGRTEGQITHLELVRRQMYGRGKIDLLQAS